MRRQTRYTTEALESNEYLVIKSFPSKGECFCIGYKNKSRKKSLDGVYYRVELKTKY